MQPRDGLAKYDQGRALFRKGQFGNAQRLLDEVAANDFENDRETRASAAFYAALAAMELYNGDAEMRVEDFAKTYELSPLANRLFFAFANHKFSLKRYRTAAEFYEKTDRLRLTKEQQNEWYFKKAYSQLSLGENESAKLLFFKLKEEDSKYAHSAKYYYAHLLYADSNYAEALTNFLPLQDDESFGPLVPYYLAHIYYELDDYEQLLKVGENLIENAVPSKKAEIAKLMGDAFYDRKDYKSALKYLEIYKGQGGRMRQRDHFELGYSQYQMGLQYDAINSFNKITGKGDESLQQNAYYHLGDLYLKIGEKEKARTAFKAASEIEASPTIREDAFFNYAKLAYELSDPYQDPIATLNDFLDEFPDSPRRKEVNQYLANLYITSKDYEKALDAIERTGMESQGMKAAYQKIAFAKASELFTAKKYQAALDKWEESLQYPLDQQVTSLTHYWLGETHYQLENYKKALEEWESFRGRPATFNLREYNRSRYQTGYAYYKQFDFQKAAQFFRDFARNAAPSDPRLPDAYLRTADSYLLTGGNLVAAEFYDKALEVNTSEADYALYKKAESEGLSNKNEQKISGLQDLLQRFPQSVYAERAQFEIAATQLQLENYQRALSGFSDFLRDYPNSTLAAKAQLQKGLAFANTDRSDEALSAYKKVVGDYPNTEEALEAVSLARLVYARTNRINDYLDWIETVDFVDVRKSELDSTAFSAAFDQYSGGDCNSAVPALQNYLDRFPKGFFALRAHYYLADCAKRLSRPSLAEKSYRQILDFQRNEYTNEALTYLAAAAFDQENYVEAQKLYERLETSAQSKTAVTNAQSGLMRAAFALGDYQKATKYADKILLQSGVESGIKNEARRVKSLALLEEGRWEESADLLQELKEKSGGEMKAEAWYNLALVRYQQKNYEKSSEVLNSLIREMPDYKEWKLRGLILLAKNYWKQDDIFQANYTLDFVIKSGYSQEIVGEAEKMKADIAEEQNRQEAEKLKQRLNSGEAGDSVLLNQGDGIIIIDK